MTRSRAALALVFLLSALASGPALTPARAQVMPEQGLPIPWFRSRSEELARQACRENRPECRASVRAQMDIEESITVILPWAALGIAILGVLFWLRAQEKKRERKKQLAKMHHTRGSFRNLDKPKRDRNRDGDDPDEEADRLAF